MQNKFLHYYAFGREHFLEWLPIILVIVPVTIALLFTAFLNTDIGYLQLHSIDEYVFHGSLRHMYLSLLEGNISGLFGYGFYQYGFIYFFINLVAVIPSLYLESSSYVIVIPRIITELFAIGSLLAVYNIARLSLEKIPAAGFVLFFVTLPAFWYNATLFHPDWPMTFFLLACVLFLARDRWQFSGNFYLAVVCYSLAVAFKYQAVTAIPILGLYIFYDQIRDVRISNLGKPIRLFLASCTTIVAIFLLANPYVFHPIGFKVFVESFITNMKSNATNHGNAVAVSLIDKINLAIGDYYVNIIFFFILNLAAFWLIWLFFKSRERNLFSILAINYTVNIGYLFVFVNKSWQVYYLPVLTSGLLLLLYFLSRLSQRKQNLAIIFMIVVQIAIYAPSYYHLITMSRDGTAPDFNTYSEIENAEIENFIYDALRNNVSPEQYVLVTPYTPFPNEKLGLTYEQVRIIFGPLDASSIDEEAYVRGQKSFWGDTKSEEEIALSFKPIDYVVLRKDIPFIKTARIANVLDQEPYWKAAQIVQDMYSGKLKYTVLAENQSVVIFKAYTD